MRAGTEEKQHVGYGIPVAAGMLNPFTGWLLSPVLASAGSHQQFDIKKVGWTARSAVGPAPSRGPGVHGT
jgi:hypothetical protein